MKVRRAAQTESFQTGRHLRWWSLEEDSAFLESCWGALTVKEAPPIPSFRLWSNIWGCRVMLLGPSCAYDSAGDFVKIQILIHGSLWVGWGRNWDSAFLTISLMMLMLLVYGPRLISKRLKVYIVWHLKKSGYKRQAAGSAAVRGSYLHFVSGWKPTE